MKINIKNFWNVVNSVFRGKFVVLWVLIVKQEKIKTSKLCNFKKVGKKFFIV